MTDEERQKLCATLRRMPGMLKHDCIRAADEIERLAAENKRLREDAESWRRRNQAISIAQIRSMIND